MRSEAEQDAKIRAEEAHKLAQAAEKNAADKREMEKKAKENLEKLNADR